MPAQMARLNEPAAAPTENLESLKRKFMRQNRDIARANSAQSLRIRNLENEISKLLADNLGLREHILRLQNELENGKSQRVASQASAIKSQLEIKLLEIGALLTGLGDEAAPKKQSPRGKLTRTSLNKSPDQKNWKNICSLSEAVAGQEGRLPPILENKSYPRRTLELHELTAILAEQAANTTDSPDIGPPPVSQFVDEDPVKIDLLKKAPNDEKEGVSGLDPALSINLEQRKKRRDSGNPSDTKKTTRFESRAEDTDGSSLKTGAKRKLSVRGDDEDAKAAQEGSDDSFSYTRLTGEVRSRLGPPAEKTASQTTKDVAVPKSATRQNLTTGAVAISARKILAPKSVNNSPKKRPRAQVTDEVKAAKEEILKADAAKERIREKRPAPAPVVAAPQPVPETVEIQPEPETPAALDLFSPQSSLPSTVRAESRDTPPPVDLGPEAEGQRPSRRARGSVSYAEPNLRDKMRRPTKELIDAVTREEARRTAIIKQEDGTQTNDSRIKAEPGIEDSWKNLPVQSSIPTEANSPLRGKAPPTITPSGLVSHRKRRESSIHQGEPEPQRLGSGSAISALLAGTRRSKVDAKETSFESGSNASKSSSPVDIYEFRTSSPTSGEIAVKVEKESRPLSRTSKRQSSVPNDLGKDDGEASDIELSRKPSTFASRRRTSTLALKSSQQSEALPSRRGAGAISDSGSDSRNDRISRRRSTML